MATSSTKMFLLLLLSTVVLLTTVEMASGSIYVDNHSFLTVSVTDANKVVSLGELGPSASAIIGAPNMANTFETGLFQNGKQVGVLPAVVVNNGDGLYLSGGAPIQFRVTHVN